MSDYIELHARSAFSFLRGASVPEHLVAEAARLKLPGLGLLDRDGVYGAPRLYQAARDTEVRALVGAEITMEDGSVVPLLVMNPKGYRNLSRLITTAKLVPRAPAVTLSLLVGLPCLKVISWNLPSRLMTAVRSLERALTTEEPTPCRPPEVM